MTLDRPDRLRELGRLGVVDGALDRGLGRLRRAPHARRRAGGGSQIIFVVRNDSIASDIVYQTSDTTWEAYNTYGGNSLYVGNPVGRAYKVSYNRPFDNANGTAHDFYFDAEFAMVRFLESNGYDVTYISGGDVDRSASILLTITSSCRRVTTSTGRAASAPMSRRPATRA